MAYKLEWSQRAVYCFFSGVVSNDDLINANKDIHGDSRFDELRVQIFSMLDASEIQLTIETVRITAALDGAAALSNPNIKCAMVATDQTIIGLSALYQDESKTSPWETAFFHSIEEALAWAKS